MVSWQHDHMLNAMGDVGNGGMVHGAEVKFVVRDRLIAGANPDDTGERLMRALSASLGIGRMPTAGFPSVLVGRSNSLWRQ